MQQAFNQLFRPWRDRIHNMVARSIVRLVNTAPGIQEMQIEIQKGETRDRCERFQNFGDSSNPLPGAEAVVVFKGGSRDHPLIVAVDDRRHRPKDEQPGESSKYNAFGVRLWLKADGSLEITAPTAVNIISPLVTMSGDLEVMGDISDKDGLLKAFREFFNNHVHDGVQTGAGNTQDPTIHIPST